MRAPAPSRRHALLGLLASPVLTTLPALSAFDPVDALWREWMAVQAALREPMTEEEEGDDETSLFSRLLARRNWLETQIEDQRPSPMRAAVSALVELEFDCELAGTPAGFDRGDASSGWLAFHVLPCLRPHLTGLVAQCVDDLTENPARPFQGSLTFRGVAGEIVS